jgi:hypothetical protein
MRRLRVACVGVGYAVNLRIQEAVYRSHLEGRRIGAAAFDPTAKA